MKRTWGIVVLGLVFLLAFVLQWHHLTKEIRELRDQILAEELGRSHADEQLLESFDHTLYDLNAQVGSVEKELNAALLRLDMVSLLPEGYVGNVTTYIKDEIETLVNQKPVFGTAWEILSMDFLSPDLVAVQCRDGEITGTLLVVIYPGDSGGYSAEVLYSNINLWAG